MKRSAALKSILLTAFLLGAWGACAAPTKQPPALPAQPVTESLHGQTVVDPYRSMEALGPETLAWIKAQGRYTRSMFDSMPGRAALGEALAAYTASIVPVDGVQVLGGRIFYMTRPPGSDNRILMERRRDGRTVVLVDVAVRRAAHGGEPYAIDYYQASPNGSKVAVGVSPVGGEDAELELYDAETGRRIAGPLPRARFALNWAGDSRGVFVTRRQDTNDPLAKYLNSRVEYWDFSHDPLPLIGAGLPDGMQMEPAEIPGIIGSPGSPWVRANIHNGVQRERQIWLASATSAERAGAPWRKLVDFSDGVISSEQRGDDLYFLSHKDAPTFKVLHLKAGRPFSEADTLLPAGGSAGGIAIGRAMEERPDLFAGAVDAVPVANALRGEFSTNGPANIPEFGTVKTERGFHSLYAMDSYQHVEPGITYPPLMITTGLNDARVPTWEPAKLAARLLSSGDPNPVLLRVDEAGGHGVTATKEQDDALYADFLSFIFWRTGRPDFQPRP